MSAPDALPHGRLLAEALAGLDARQLGAEVRSTLRWFTLDTLGVIAGAARAPGMQELLAAVRDLEAGGAAMTLLDGGSASPPTAALANGAAAHALDFDDQHDPARVHAFCVVLPAVLACLPAASDRSGTAVLTALAAGVEVFCRLGLVCHNSLGKGWHPTTALGSLAAAAAASKLLGLDVDQTLHALGLAYTQLSGTTQFIADGALAKRVGPGFAARNGVLSAFLARRGITGPGRFLEGAAGLFQLHERGEVKPELLLEGFGTRWDLLDLSMKPFPCCRCAHTTIQLALDARADGIAPADIESGVIELSQVNHQIVGAPFDRRHANPTVHAQFNAAYTFAAALVDGGVGIGSFAPAQVQRDDTAWAARLQSVVAADMPPTAVAPARVRLQLRDGRSWSRERWQMKGSPQEPMSEAEVVAKFRACVDWGFGTPAAAVDRLQALVLSLDELPDAGALPQAFAALR